MAAKCSAIGWALCWGSVPPLAAQQLPNDGERTGTVPIFARSQTTLRVFQRAVGPRGSITETDTLVPIYEYWGISAPEVPTAWSPRPSSFELSGWLDGTFGERRHEQPLIGDITSAWFAQPLGPVSLKLGRQASFGGAGRYVRFDGLNVGWDSPVGSRLRGGVELYTGYTVLPRWDARPGYHHLGSVADSLVRDPAALPEAERSGDHLFGGRARLKLGELHQLGVSFHQQHAQGELFRRNMGLDVKLQPLDGATLTGDVVLDTDGPSVVDANVWLDLELDERWWGALSYLHVNPALYLSRQSVLSVFDAASFDELGAEVSYLPIRGSSVTGRAFLEWFAEGRLGTRSELQLRTDLERSASTRLGLTYARVLVPEGGYHSVRNSLRRRLSEPLTATAEAYFYFYDRAISSRRSASVYATNVAWAWAPAWQLLLGGSLAQTPYAVADLQTLLRLSYDATWELGGNR